MAGQIEIRAGIGQLSGTSRWAKFYVEIPSGGYWAPLWEIKGASRGAKRETRGVTGSVQEFVLSVPAGTLVRVRDEGSASRTKTVFVADPDAAEIEVSAASDGRLAAAGAGLRGRLRPKA